MAVKINWSEAVRPLLNKYKGKAHPLHFKNTYQLLVMVVLAAQDRDDRINQVAAEFFKVFPDMKTLSKATPETIARHIHNVRNFNHKAIWLAEMAKQIKNDKGIPQQLDMLTALPGIGRKSANVILRESGKPAEGIIVDLHVVRVAPRIGIASGTDPKKIEKQMMEILPSKDWDIGMAMSFLGREICRPTNPQCDACVMNNVCVYYLKSKKAVGNRGKKRMVKG